MAILKQISHFAYSLAFAIVVGILTWPALANGQGWNEVPERLRLGPGSEIRGDLLYVTAVVRAGSYRQDKAMDAARRKSLQRSLQMVHLAGPCRELIEGVARNVQNGLVEILLPFMPSRHMHGLTVIRQWEADQASYTAVSIPLKAVKGIRCEIPDISTGIARYVRLNDVSLRGLEFCLNHASRYSRLNHAVRNRIGRWYQDRNLSVLARCFLSDVDSGTSISPLQAILFQDRLAKAALLTRKAEGLYREGKWETALDLASRALELVPTFSRTYLLLSKYFLEKEMRPAFALCPVEKAYQDASSFRAALVIELEILEKMESPEAELFRYLLAQTENGTDGSCPGLWKKEIERLHEFPVPCLIMASRGQLIQGPPKRPGDRFARAVGLYEKAQSTEDVQSVLDILLAIIQEDPQVGPAHNLAGACYRHLNQPGIALPFLWQALKLKPDYDLALTNLGLCCQDLGLMQSARYYFGHKAIQNSTNTWVDRSVKKFYKSHQQAK